MNKKWLALISILVLIVIMIAGCTQAAPGQTITLKFSTWMPAGKNHPDYSKAERMFAEITKRSNGQVKFEMYPSGQLAGQKEQIDGIKNGLFDIATYMSSTTPNKTPLYTINWQPWTLTDSVLVQMEAMRELAKNSDLKKELEAWNALYFACCGGGPRILMSKPPFKTLDSFKGLKIRAAGREAEAYKLFGATPVAIPTKEVYDALQKGTIDATTQPYINLVSYGINEVTKYVFTINAGMGSPIFIISKSTYDKLPSNIKKIVMDVALEDDIIHGKDIDSRIVIDMNAGKKEGKQTFVDCSPADQAKFMDVVADQIMSEWVKEMKDKGLDGKGVFDAYRKAQEKFME